jgi:tetratricopeptide (TPR) repeat protein
MFVPVDDVSADAVPVLDDLTVRAWVEVLCRRCEELGRDGTVYQTLVVPEATAVYSDRLPDDLALVAPTPFQRLLDALDDDVAEHCVYPLDDLVAGRERAETFGPGETLWTDWGAWVGYRASITALASVVPGVRVLDEDDVEWSSRAGASDETAGAGGAEAAARVRSPRARISMSLSTEDGDTYLVVEQDAPDLPTAVVFRDSFMDAAAKFFAESFRRTIFVSTPNVVHRDLVDRERPDVVIHELSERRLSVSPDEPGTPDFRTVFGDLLLDDAEARSDQRRSRSLTRAGRLEEALGASDEVLARVPPTARLMLHRAQLHLGTGRVDAGLEALRHAATLDPDDGAVWALLGQVLARTPGHEAESVRALARAAHTQPEDAVSWQRAISAALRADDLRLAEELRREALTRHPDDPQLANAASWVLAATGKLAEAEDAAGYAARAQPDVVEHLWQLASIQIRRGRMDDASVTMAKLERLRPEDPDVQHYCDVLGRAASAQKSTQGGNDEGQR